MRTTVTIDDDVIRLAKAIAHGRDISVGKALSELARRGLQATAPRRRVRGFAVFDVPDDAPVIDAEQVRQAEVAADEGRYRGRVR